MATFEFVLPELGEGMEAGDVVQVLVSCGGEHHGRATSTRTGNR